MKKYEVLKETNTSSELLKICNDLESAKKTANEEIKNTDPENENEGINIYDENGMILSYFKNSITKINSKNE
jgi:hypothetical protein